MHGAEHKVSWATKKSLIPSGVDLTTGLLAWWSMDTTSWLDSTPNARNLTAAKSPTVAAGLVGNALSLTAVVDEYLYRTSEAWMMPNTFTICGWMKPNNITVTSTYSLLTKRGSYNMQFRVSGGGTTNDFLFVTATSGGVVNLSNTTKPTTSNYSFFCARYDGSIQKLRIDTTETTIAQSGTLNQGAFELQVGSFAFSGAGSQEFDGFIDEVAMWNIPLDDDQVDALYNNGNGIAYPG